MKAKLLIFHFVLTATLLFAGPRDLPQIEWLRHSVRIVADQGCYARAIRLTGNELLCCYEYRGQCWIRRSLDNGMVWSSGIRVTDYDLGMAANPTLIRLRSGNILLGYNERPERSGSHYTICLVASDNDGRSWGRRRQLYEAGTSQLEGCWEPDFLQYPDGEIQLFFANEADHTYSSDQEISMLRSRDGGASWQGSHSVAYRSGHRDGMPVSCFTGDGKTVVLAIEDNGLNGEMKPVILRDTIEARWRKAVIKGNSASREAALLEPLAADVYAGAPYICRMPSGVMVLSVQSRERRTHEEPAVYVGDNEARNFTNRSFPFELASGVKGSWNSLYVKDEHTVTLLSTTEIGGRRGIWAIDGRLRH